MARKPIYQLHADYRKGLISRRELLKRSAAAGAATSLIVNYLDAGDVSAAPAPHFSLTKSVAQSGALSAPGADADTSESLIFRGWNYLPEIVIDNTSRFNEAYSETADYQTITGDYIGIMENFHIANQPLDLAYANPATLYRWSIPGWVHDYERWWSVEDAKAEMYPGVLESMTIDDRLYGLPYFVSIRGTIAANNSILDQAGITPDLYPKTWAELYDQARQIKAEGIADTPLLPHWFTAGVWFGPSWGYLFECMNTGAVLFDENNIPVFDDATLAVLENWRALYDEGVVSESVFNMGEADYIDAFAQGTYAFSPQQLYDLKVFNDPARSPLAGQFSAVPVVDQPWGLIDEGIYSVPNRDDSDEKLARKYRLGGFFGYKDQNDQLMVAKRWAIESALNSGYTAILEDPEVIAAYDSWMPETLTLETLNGILNAGQFPRVWQTFWWEEWNATAMTELPQAILGQKSVEDAHATLKALAEELAERYAS
ncbi:MAG: ABC transporter substrate-binding protein [Thermomicrobiales bacterium]